MARRFLAPIALPALVALAACSPPTSDDARAEPAAPSSITSTSATSPSPPPDPTVAAPPADLCADLDTELRRPVVAEPALVEISGAVLSRRSSDAIWVHEDSGNAPVLTELGLDGTVLSRWVVTGARNVDWEDVAAATDPAGVRHLFIGDVGDNQRRRSHVELVRIPEPDAADDSGATAPAAVLRLELPDGPSDVEALIVDPHTADVILLTKELSGVAQVLVAPGGAWGPDDSTLRLAVAGTLRLGPGQALLAADLSPAGDLVAVRTPFRVLLWPHAPGTPVVQTLLGSEPCRAPAVFDPVGEALGLLDDGYVLVGESSAPELVLVR